MRLLIFIALSLGLSTLTMLAAETPSQRSQRELRARDTTQREADQASLLARSNNGLIIVHYNYGYRGWGFVTVRNITSMSVNFDFHQVRGVELDTGNITEAGDIGFDSDEIVSYEVKPGAERGFRVFFVGGRAIAAAAWRGREDWWFGGKSYADLTEPLAIARKAAVAQRKAYKKSTVDLRGVVVK